MILPKDFSGTIMTVVGFPLVFMGWPPYPSSGGQTNGTAPDGRETDSPAMAWMVGIYYGVLIVIFQVGWAVVQIAHLALIPLMTPHQSERAELTTIRWAGGGGGLIFRWEKCRPCAAKTIFIKFGWNEVKYQISFPLKRKYHACLRTRNEKFFEITGE